MMTSIQLEECVLELRKTGSLGQLSRHVREILRSRGLDPQVHKALWRAMVNRTVIQYNYQLDEQEYWGFS
ncbi:MAG: hypothetical protein ACYS7Y_35730 [Planctomycetota bacterium]|jgi:hypothetical protein